MIARARFALNAAAAVLMAGLVLVTCIDVVGRYLFDSPLGGAFELTQVLLGALVFVALPLTTAAGAHVEVDLLVPLLPQAMVRVLGWLGGIVTAAVLLYFAFRLIILTQDHLAVGTRTAALGLPMWVLGVIGVASCCIAAVIAMVRRPT
ncbi:TRAP transporter small permease [Rhizobium sullae]|uniref:TRAP transporter small permease protein n=1 Tax=Rhizobium sullae TaxID=50338 RepID=A0A2N0DEG9_RHISU|nr:TRAP transporter small permease [Rhizobium sullae]PKA44472.1 TRAP transporter small permease [Rhizobium sullae]